MPGGRPTKYDPAMCEQATAFMAQGFSKAETSAHLGITRETLYQWEKEKPEFSYAIKEGENQSALWWAKMGMAGMSGKIAGFNATVWIFNMKNRHGWADRTDVNHGGQAGNPVKYEEVRRNIVDPKHSDS